MGLDVGGLPGQMGLPVYSRLLPQRTVFVGKREFASGETFMTDTLLEVEKPALRAGIPAFSPGDSIRVHVKVREGEKERIQIFAGVVIARRGGGSRETFTVRKISSGIGVERIFPLHSPVIDRIEVERKGAVRRAKLYYLRERKGKAARIAEKRVEKFALRSVATP